MNKCKSIIVLLFVCCFVCLNVGCGNVQKKVTEKQNDTQTSSEVTSEETAEQKTEEEVSEDDMMPDVEGETIYIYSYDDSFGEILEYFYKKYPEYKQRVQLVSADMGPTSEEYQHYVRDALNYKKTKKKDEDQVLGAGEEHKYPSIVVNSSMMAYVFAQNDYSTSLTSAGISESELDSMYPYTVNKARFLGDVKGLTWYTSPGVFLYRTDIAEEVFGASDEATVQSKISDWTLFGKTTQEIKEAGYKMLSGQDEVTYAMMQQKEKPWVTDEQLHIDASAKICLGFSRKLKEEECTNETFIFDDERRASFDGDVFGWFVYPEEIYSGIETELHKGEFRVCEGPGAYQWGSDYLSISPNCRDIKLAALVLRTLCLDEEVLREMEKDKGLIVNHREIVQEMAKSKQKVKQLGGQNPKVVFAKTLEDINGDTVTPYDEQFEAWVRELSYQYNDNEFEEMELVFDVFKDKVSDQFNYIFIK